MFLFIDNPEQAKYIESKFGNPMLLDRNGHVFTANGGYKKGKLKKGDKNWWRCRESMRKRKSTLNKCPAKATTDSMNVVTWRYEHNH